MLKTHALHPLVVCLAAVSLGCGGLGRHAGGVPPQGLQPAGLGSFSFDAPVGTLPPDIEVDKIIRGFWFYYPHAPSPGKRFWLQVDNNTWVERYANGHETRFRVVGRLSVQGAKGELLVKIHGDPSVTTVLDDGSFQVFIPDKGEKVTDAQFRNLIKGQWQSWRTLGKMRVIK